MFNWPKFASIIGSTNVYTHLKWPLTFASILTTLLAFILMLSFRSNAWFTYELIHTDNRTSFSNQTFSRTLEYGSIGLWTICFAHMNDLNVKCDVWTKDTRPYSFNVIIILVSCALFLSNLTVFPSWASSILIVYNSNNRYIRHVLVFIWILLILTLSFTVLLILAMLLIALTPFSSPGRFIYQSKSIYFHSDHGLLYASLATILSIICSIVIIITLIWKKLIEMKLFEAERDLLKRLSDDNFQPGWHRIVMAPRASASIHPFPAPPPYGY